VRAWAASAVRQSLRGHQRVDLACRARRPVSRRSLAARCHFSRGPRRAEASSRRRITSKPDRPGTANLANFSRHHCDDRFATGVGTATYYVRVSGQRHVVEGPAIAGGHARVGRPAVRRTALAALTNTVAPVFHRDSDLGPPLPCATSGVVCAARSRVHYGRYICWRYWPLATSIPQFIAGPSSALVAC